MAGTNRTRQGRRVTTRPRVVPPAVQQHLSQVRYDMVYAWQCMGDPEHQQAFIQEVRRLCDQASVALPAGAGHASDGVRDARRPALVAPSPAVHVSSSGAQDQDIPRLAWLTEESTPTSVREENTHGDRQNRGTAQTRAAPSNASSRYETQGTYKRGKESGHALARQPGRSRPNAAPLPPKENKEHDGMGMSLGSSMKSPPPSPQARRSRPGILKPVTYSISNLFDPDYINPMATRIASRLARNSLNIVLSNQNATVRLTHREACIFLEWFFHDGIGNAMQRVDNFCDKLDEYQANNSLAAAVQDETIAGTTRHPLRCLLYIHTQDLSCCLKSGLRVMNLVELWQQTRKPGAPAADGEDQSGGSDGEVRQELDRAEDELSQSCGVQKEVLQQYTQEAEVPGRLSETWGYGAIFFLPFQGYTGVSSHFKYPSAMSQILETVRAEDPQGMLPWLQNILFNKLYKTFTERENGLPASPGSQTSMDYIRACLERVRLSNSKEAMQGPRNDLERFAAGT